MLYAKARRRRGWFHEEGSENRLGDQDGIGDGEGNTEMEMETEKPRTRAISL